MNHSTHRDAVRPLPALTIDFNVLFQWIRRHSAKLLALGLVLHLMSMREVEIEVSMGQGSATASHTTTRQPASAQSVSGQSVARAVNVSHVTKAHQHAPAAPAGQPDFNDVASTDDPAPHISNLTLILSPDYAERKGLPAHIVRAKLERVNAYVRRYASAAQREMRDYGIPASITLAQGILESNAGDSRLAVESLNHFGIKCRSKCRGCTCRNYKDDSAYDMFRVFGSAADSYREHSILLSSARYRQLKDYGIDYRKWAHGLKRAGYATDKRYAEKLIKIIRQLELHQYDR